MSLPNISLIRLDGRVENLTDYAGRVLLIVNVASQCGFTPQYQPLQALYQKYVDQGLTVMGFPCNQFGSQEPGDAQQIGQFCETRFGVTFPLYEKCDVNGANTHPLFEFLKVAAPGLFGTQAIKWNFTKFLVNRSGSVVDRYAPATGIDTIEAALRPLLPGAQP
jgi:glutathione peroxidase